MICYVMRVYYLTKECLKSRQCLQSGNVIKCKYSWNIYVTRKANSSRRVYLGRQRCPELVEDCCREGNLILFHRNQRRRGLTIYGSRTVCISLPNLAIVLGGRGSQNMPNCSAKLYPIVQLIVSFYHTLSILYSQQPRSSICLKQ